MGKTGEVVEVGEVGEVDGIDSSPDIRDQFVDCLEHSETTPEAWVFLRALNSLESRRHRLLRHISELPARDNG